VKIWIGAWSNMIGKVIQEEPFSNALIESKRKYASIN
jgi:hypothetical protein